MDMNLPDMTKSSSTGSQILRQRWRLILVSGNQNPKISPIRLPDNLLCPVRAFEIFLQKRPAAEPGNPYVVWLVMKSTLSCLVRRTIKESFELFDPRSQARGFDPNTRVKCHDLRKYACSYSRKYVDRTGKSLAQRVGSKTFTTLDNCYIRDVPRVKLTFQVPLGTVNPRSYRCHRLKTD